MSILGFNILSLTLFTASLIEILSLAGRSSSSPISVSTVTQSNGLNGSSAWGYGFSILIILSIWSSLTRLLAILNTYTRTHVDTMVTGVNPILLKSNTSNAMESDVIQNKAPIAVMIPSLNFFLLNFKLSLIIEFYL